MSEPTPRELVAELRRCQSNHFRPQTTDLAADALESALDEMEARELHHFEAEKALTDLLSLSWAITRDSHCSHLGSDIRFLIPADVLNAETAPNGDPE